MREPQAALATVMWLFGAAIILIVADYSFLIAAFYLNGLHHYSYGEIAAQTPNVGNGTLSGAPYFVNLNMRLLVWGLLVAGFGRSVLLLAVMGLSVTLIGRWTRLRWAARLGWISVILSALPMLSVMRSPLSRSILAWLLD